MRLGVKIGPFYASTSTRRRRSGDGLLPGAVIAVVVVIGVLGFPWMLAFEENSPGREWRVLGWIGIAVEALMVIAAIALMMTPQRPPKQDPGGAIVTDDE